MTVDIKVKLYPGHTSEINCCSFSTDEQLMVTASDDNTMVVWNATTKKNICSLLGHTGPVNTCSFSPNNKLLASGSSDKTVRIWEMSTADCLKKLTGHSKSVQQVSFSADGCRLCSVSWDRCVIIWNIDTGEIKYCLQGHASCVNTCCFSYDDIFLASGSWDYTVRLWKLKKENHKHKDEKLLLTGFKKVLSYDHLYVATLKGHTGNVNSVKFSRVGLLASASWDHSIILWNPSKAIPLKKLLGHTGWVRAISFSQNSLELMSVSDDNTMRVWNVLSGEHLQFCQETLDITSNCFFSPSGSLLVAGSYLLPSIKSGPNQTGLEF